MNKSYIFSVIYKTICNTYAKVVNIKTIKRNSK